MATDKAFPPHNRKQLRSKAAYDLRRQTRDIDVQAAGLDNNEESIARPVREIAETPTKEDDGIEFDEGERRRAPKEAACRYYAARRG